MRIFFTQAFRDGESCVLQSDSFDYSVCPCVELVVKSIFLFTKEEEDEAATETVIEAGRRSNRRH